MMAAADQWRMVVRGRGGHASVPSTAADPIPVAAEIVLALQSMVTRRVDLFDPAVVTVAHIPAGSTSNVIPDTAFIEGTIRTLSAERRAESWPRCSGWRARGRRARDDRRVRARRGLSGDGQRPRLGRDGARRRGRAARAGQPSSPAPLMGAEDFSYVLQQVPGAMASSAPARPASTRRPRRPTTRTWSSSTRSRSRPAWPSTRRWPCRPSPAERISQLGSQVS